MCFFGSKHGKGIASGSYPFAVTPVAHCYSGWFYAMHTLDARYLKLEMAESTAIHQERHVVEQLQMMKNLGITVSIDDFGTGYSSLSYLRKFPFGIKIDRSFVRNVSESSDDGAIVQAMIAMAHSHKLRVLAEGVEKQAQLDFLKEHQCDEVQGYLLSHPLPAEDLQKIFGSFPFSEVARKKSFIPNHIAIVTAVQPPFLFFCNSLRFVVIWNIT